MRRNSMDGGVTRVELLIVIVVMGVITIPLTDFVLSYMRTNQTTQNRLTDSADMQILTAYFSEDVSNAGVYAAQSGSAYQYQQGRSVWTSGFDPGTCGQ